MNEFLLFGSYSLALDQYSNDLGSKRRLLRNHSTQSARKGRLVSAAGLWRALARSFECDPFE